MPTHQNCLECHTLLPIEDFYYFKNSSNLIKIKNTCKKCTRAIKKKQRYDFKKECVDYMGGKCSNCGYDKTLAALEFHHIDPDEKDFSISSSKSLKVTPKIRKELKKCVLLCANCHREEHVRLKKLDH